MTDYPIIMTAESVLAILDGRKSQTRRVIRSLPSETCWEQQFAFEGPDGPSMKAWIAACPYGAVGDRLYVRESLRCHNTTEPPTATYVADASPVVGHGAPESYCGRAVWRWPKSRLLTARYMPRWASRLTLEVTNVRVERVGAITESDAAAEGYCTTWAQFPMTNREAFARLWDSLNKRRGYPWASSPWVWAITFQRVEGVG